MIQSSCGQIMGSKEPYVLLIEDEEAHAELIVRAFAERSDRMHWTVARNLHDARALIEESTPELVITDLLLPDGRGFELLPIGGQQSPFPVVIMTGHGDEDLAVEAMKAGAQDYVKKSATNLSELPEIAERVLGEWRNLAERQRVEKAASERDYRNLYDEAPCIGLTVDVRGNVVSANNFAARQLGYRVEELEGMPLSRLYARSEEESALRHLEACFRAADTLQRWQTFITDKNGKPNEVRVTARVVCSEDGERLAHLVCEEFQSEEARVADPAATTPVSLSLQNMPEMHVSGGEYPKPRVSERGYRVLVVDDDPVICHLTEMTLRGAGFDVWTAASGIGALNLLEQRGLPHLAIVDLLMPGMSGYKLCSQIQEFCDLPIITLTSVNDKGTVADTLRTIAEDYIVKPFDPGEFLARIERLLRRIGDFAYALEPRIRVDDRLEVEFARRTAYVEGQPVELTPTETKLLYILMRNAGRTVVTDYLIRRIWPLDEVFEEALRTHVYRLRRKIEVLMNKPRYVITRRGIGYTFAVRS